MKPFVITSVLAPTDLSDSSIPALRYARLFADRFSAKLTVMYTDPIVYPVDLAGPADGLYINTTPEHQAQLRRDVEPHVASVMAGHPYDIDVTIGQPIPSILAAARERNADLIVTLRLLPSSGRSAASKSRSKSRGPRRARGNRVGQR